MTIIVPKCKATAAKTTNTLKIRNKIVILSKFLIKLK